MLTAKAEAVQRLTLPFASPKDQPADDMFADLLRQLDEPAEPAAAPRPEKPRAAPAQRAEEPRAAPAKRAEEPRQPEVTTAVETPAPAAASKPTETAPAKSGEAGNQAVETAGKGDGADQPDGTASPAPATADLASPSPAPMMTAAGTESTPATAVPALTAAPAGAPVIAEASAAAPEPAAPPSDAPSAKGTPPAGEAPAIMPQDPATAPTTAVTASDRPAGQTAPTPQAADPAAPALNAAEAVTAADPAAPTGEGDGNAVVRVERSPAPALAQGLGKLGSGAEVALAAQAIGDTMQSTAPGQVRKAGSATPQSAAAGKPGQDGAPAAAQPAIPAAAPAAPAAIAPAAAAAQPEIALAQAGTATDESVDALGGPATTGLRNAGAAHAAVATAAPRAAAVPTPAEQVAVQIQRAVGDGASRITVQLKPAELGSIEVQLDFAQDGRVSASILADRPETLDLLQRDARLLERSLQDAGLKADSGSLSFDLRGGSRQDQGSAQTAARTAPEKAGAEPRLAAANEITRPATTAAASGGVDIRV